MFLSSSSRITILIYVLCCLNVISTENLQDVKQWMCADEKCSVPISISAAQKRYVPDDDHKVGVSVGDKLEILRKPVDPSYNYYYVQSKATKKKGLLKKDFIREKQVFYHDGRLVEVDLSERSDKKLEINPSAPTHVYDGTTILDSFEGSSYPYEPTQAQGPANDAGSPSIVQSTTPPSVIGEDSSSSVNSDVDSNNGTDGVSKSKDSESGGSASPSIAKPVVDDPASNPDDVIASTPASTIINVATQSEVVPNISNDIPATAEIPASSAQIDKSQTPESVNPVQELTNSEVKNNVDDGHGTSEEAKQGTLMENIASGWRSFVPYGNDGGNPESLKPEDQQNNVTNESSTSEESSDEPVKSDVQNEAKPLVGESSTVDQQQHISEVLEYPKQPADPQATTEEHTSNQNTSTSVTSDDTHDEKVLSEPIELPQEQSNKEVNLDAKSSEKADPNVENVPSESSAPLAANTDLPSTSNLSGEQSQNVQIYSVRFSNTSDPHYPTPSKDDTEGRTNSVVEQVEPPQATVIGETVAESKGLTEEGERSNAGSSFESSQNKEVNNEKLPTQPAQNVISDQETVDEISADSDVDDSNVAPQNSTSEDFSGGDRSVMGEVPSGNQTENSVYSSVPVKTEDASPSPRTEEASPSPRTEEASPSPRTEEASPSPRTEETSPSPRTEETSPSPRTEETSPSPRTEETSPSPRTEEASTSPRTEEASPSPSSFIFSELNYVDPRQTNPAISSSIPTTEVPSVTEEPKIEAAVNSPDMPAPNTDEAATTLSPPISEPGIVDKSEQVLDEVPLEPLIQEDPSDPWYSGVLFVFGNIQEMFSSQVVDTEVIPSSEDTPEVTSKFQEDEESETCTTDVCVGQHQIDLDAKKEETSFGLNQVWLSPGSTLLMTITAAAVLIFSLGYYYLENVKRDVELVSKYNDLAGKLFIEQKEKEMLAEQLTSANESMTQISFDTTKYDEEINELRALAQKYKEEKMAIEEKEKETRKKFIMVDKNYNELRSILSQNKQKGERSALILDIKNLKESIAGNNIEIASLKEQLIEKKEEIKSLNSRIMEFMETNKQLEANVEKAISDNHETAQKYQDNVAKLEKTIEESTAARVKLEKECTQLKKERESLAIEKELAESTLQKYQRLKPLSNSLAEWLDAKEVRVSLLAAEKKVEELTTIRDDLLREKNLLEVKQSTLKLDFEQLNEKYEKAEKDKIEALTKLQVLSDYFKEKETQLQEELGTKESLWLQKQSDDRTIYEQMRALREENTSYKNQNETLKREILDQEASFKKLITSAEEKAHENWVALRHHERRLKEAQMEASQLRSRLTALEATGDSSEDKINKGEVNGDIPSYGSATSPPFMLYPEFVPPPPLLPNTPSRPPPLGRISSPPLGDFTPPPPLVPYDMFLPPSPPPPAPHVLHKPQPLDGSHRIQKNSQSSNHSSDSVPDRPRRNKR